MLRASRQEVLVPDVIRKRRMKSLGPVARAFMCGSLDSPPSTLEEKDYHHPVLQRKTLGLRKVK